MDRGAVGRGAVGSPAERLACARAALGFGFLTQGAFDTILLSEAERTRELASREKHQADGATSSNESQAGATSNEKQAATSSNVDEGVDGLSASLGAVRIEPSKEAAAEDEEKASSSAPKGHSVEVGSSVRFKDVGGRLGSGVVKMVHASGALDIETESGRVFAKWPAKSCKLIATPTESSVAADAIPSDRKPLPGFALIAEKRDLSRASSETPKPPPPPPEAAASGPPRMPTLTLVVDTNVLLDTGKLDGRYLLQDCSSVDVLIPSQVLIELDGLKVGDSETAMRARRANAFLAEVSAAATKGGATKGGAGGWLRLEEKVRGDGDLGADELILASALNYAEEKQDQKDAVVLCTNDKNLQLKARAQAKSGAVLEALTLGEARRKAEGRDRAWRAAYAHILPGPGDNASRQNYLRNY